MSKNLVIVESPSKAKTINKYLGSSYKVEATIGHIRNLPKTKLGVDIDDNFKPQLTNIRGKGDVIKKIREYAKKSAKIFIATDPDREGEAIAQDIVEVIEKHSNAKIYRVLFHEITKASVKEAMQNPREIDSHLVVSQRARRVMDRIIGYKISPFLWTTVVDDSGNSLSAGRVQSVALRLICEREEEIKKFIPIEYWSIIGDFLTPANNEFQAKLHSIDKKLIKLKPKNELTENEWLEFNKKFVALDNSENVNKILTKIKKLKNFIITELVSKEIKRNPNPPFITSTLQAEASKVLRMRSRKTMQVAQSLYEGIDLGADGLVGLITYMRTDSTRLNAEIVEDARNYIANVYGDKYKPENPRNYEKKKGNIQDAHEAIRPTSIAYSPEKIKGFLNEEQFKLYDLIWKRFIASQMESALLETTTATITEDIYTFKVSGTIIKFNGYMTVYEEIKEDNNNENDDTEDNLSILPSDLKENLSLILNKLNSNQHFTKPPARYSESSLIKELEDNGIGRPSTYASIVSTLQDRNYVDLIDRKYRPTNLGFKVNSILIKNFSELFNVRFTAEMELELDQIAEGGKEYLEVLNHFYTPFMKNLKNVENTVEKIKCDKCNSDMEIKIGKFGRFLACTNYPTCKNIKSLAATKKDNDEPEFTGEDCPKCSSKLIFRNSKFGKFIGCEKYPDCDYTKQLTLDIKCPECEDGEIVTRRTKKGRIFYGCSNYPKCSYTSWKMPEKSNNE